jgi:hypothetical protein
MAKHQQNSYPFYIRKPAQQLHKSMIEGVILDKNFREPVYPRPINNSLYAPNFSQFDAKSGVFSPNFGNYNNNLSFSNIANSQYRKS